MKSRTIFRSRLHRPGSSSNITGKGLAIQSSHFWRCLKSNRWTKFVKVDAPTRGSDGRRCSMLHYGRSRRDVSRARMTISVSLVRSLVNLRSRARSVKRKKRIITRYFSIGVPGRSRRRTRNRPKRNGPSCSMRLPNVRLERRRKPNREPFQQFAPSQFRCEGRRAPDLTNRVSIGSSFLQR